MATCTVREGRWMCETTFPPLRATTAPARLPASSVMCGLTPGSSRRSKDIGAWLPAVGTSRTPSALPDTMAERSLVGWEILEEFRSPSSRPSGKASSEARSGGQFNCTPHATPQDRQNCQPAPNSVPQPHRTPPDPASPSATLTHVGASLPAVSGPPRGPDESRRPRHPAPSGKQVQELLAAQSRLPQDGQQGPRGQFVVQGNDGRTACRVPKLHVASPLADRLGPGLGQDDKNLLARDAGHPPQTATFRV